MLRKENMQISKINIDSKVCFPSVTADTDLGSQLP